MPDSRPDAGQTDKPVKLRCRSLWKVYGADPGQWFNAGPPGREAATDLAATLRNNAHIVAAGDVSFDVHTGEIFVIMGLSGSGKSTVVRCLSRLVEPTAGSVHIDDQDLLQASHKELIEIRRHRMGMVFQNFGLLPHLSVLENVAFPLKAQGVSDKQRLERAQQMVELVGLKGREDAYPRELSGGQQQRVGIARSLAVEPEIWFLDEPFSALDPLIRRQMQDEFIRLQTMLHKTIVFITHDFLEALRVADRICIMKDGFIEQIGTPSEVVLHPATDYVAEFTRDVPLARVVTVGSVMRQTAVGTRDGLPTVESNAFLGEAMATFGAGTDRLLVTDAGVVVGELTPGDIVRGLAHEGKG